MASPIALRPIHLQGHYVDLHPLAQSYSKALASAIEHGDLWRSPLANLPEPSEMVGYIEDALKAQASGAALPFAIVERASGTAVGSTRFGNYAPEHRRVEIGWTWLGIPWQRTALNSEAKYLLLLHAFETLNCVRVELKTGVMNERSRAAIRRLGAREEGILRQHMIMPGGRLRDTVYYSILDHEWPEVKERLKQILHQHR